MQETVFFAVANLLNLEVDMLFLDTTSTYFELDDEDDPDAATVSTLRRFGKSKDHRPDLPQVVIGLAVTREGIPVGVWVWPGNTTDATVIPQAKEDLRGWKLGQAVTVADRGRLRLLTGGQSVGLATPAKARAKASHHKYRAILESTHANK